MKRILLLWIALTFCPTGWGQTETVRLRRFERINPYRQMTAIAWGEKAYTYMDVADTTLDSRQPDANFGASKTLRLAPNADHKILIQFGQLNRAIWRGSQIKEVQLILHPVSGRFAPGTNLRFYRLTSEWREGGADGKPMYWTATYNAAFSSPRGNAIPWHSGGAKGSRDRLTPPSHTQSTSTGYDANRNRWVIQSPGLLRDVRYWFGKQYRNFGWLLEMENPRLAKGAVEFYSSDVLEKELRPELVITFEPLRSEGEQKGVDLNVTFIERTPRYLRYHDNGTTSYERKPYRDDNPGILKFPDFADTPKWPRKGQLMTYTAHIKNSGFAPYKGALDYRWTYNGKVIQQGTLKVNLAPERSVTLQVQLPWKGDMRDIRDEKLWLEIDPHDKIQEITKNNNAQSKYLKARTWKYWVERKPYRYSQQFLTAYGSYAFEDYLKWHESLWNETFLDKSRFEDFAPDGCLQRITLDDFEIVADGRLRGSIHRPDDKPDCHFDGEWGTEWLKGNDANDPEKVKNLQHFLRGQRIFLEGSLLHEASHQVLGAFDVYWSNQEPSEPKHPNGKVKTKDDGDHYITRGAMYAFGGLMGGDDTRPSADYWEGTGLYEAHSIGGFNSNLPYRNGFYGEWQYDLPRSISVRLLSADGATLPNARVKIWQCSANQMVDKHIVAENLISDGRGILKLPDQDSLEEGDVTTITGHTLLKKNPFGRIDVVGTNVVLLLRIEAFGQRDYRFVRLFDLNRAYWAGHKDAYVHDVHTQIAPTLVEWDANWAEDAEIETSLNDDDAYNLVDGDTDTAWQGGDAPTGAYIQVGFEDPILVSAVRLYQNGMHGMFFQRFKIEVSNDPEFRTGVTLLNQQHPTSFALAMTNDRDIDPENPRIRWVTYGTRPTEAQYLRITNLEPSRGVHLSELEVYSIKLGN